MWSYEDVSSSEVGVGAGIDLSAPIEYKSKAQSPPGVGSNGGRATGSIINRATGSIINIALFKDMTSLKGFAIGGEMLLYAPSYMTNE